jgi:hypothetical protein
MTKLPAPICEASIGGVTGRLQVRSMISLVGLEANP